MVSDKLLIFDISAEYGHFRKFNTTTSPLTYSLPTLPALAGLMGAILGIEREQSANVFRSGLTPVNEVFDRTETAIAIQVLQPIKKVNMGFNLLNTKSRSNFFNIDNRTQIEFELLKDPKFRIYFGHTDTAIYQALKKRIGEVSHHFSPYLGLSQFTATVDYVGELVPVEKVSEGKFVEIHSALNLSKDAFDIQFENAHYATDTLPIHMQRDRVVKEYGEIILEKNGRSIRANVPTYYELEGYGNVVFL